MRFIARELNSLVLGRGESPPADLRRFAQELSVPRDRWGREWIYRADGRKFLLASFGADGAPDASQTMDLDQEVNDSMAECSGVNSDQMLIGSGWIHRCWL